MPIATHHILTLEVRKASAEKLASRIESDWGLSVIQLERPGHDRSWLEMYFTQPEQAALAAEVMRSWRGVAGHMIREESPRDWQTFWRHHFHTTDVGRRLRIVPIWEKEKAGRARGGRKTIWLDPGLSFGTGDHFTTRFCLEMIDRLVPAPKRGGSPAVRSMLDIGTGSAILAIAARLLGVPKVVGFDHDAIALEQAHENVALNKLSGQIKLGVADITTDPPKGSFDLVCANVYTTILLQIAPAVCACARRHLVLSGIRDPELDQVSMAYAAQGFEETFRDGNGEWGGIALQRMKKK